MNDSPCLLLIRHAQSQNNAFAEPLRIPDPDLTELGVSQAKKLERIVSGLAPTVVYCSPFLRSLETTRLAVHNLDVIPIVRQDLYEQGGCHSGFQPGNRVAEFGMNRSTLAQRYVGWKLDDRIDERGWYHSGHYETAIEAKERAQRVHRWFESETHFHDAIDRVAMIIHADFKMRLLEAFLGDDSIEQKLGDIVNTSVSRLSKSAGRWRLDYWNVFNHLERDEISM